MPIDYEKVIAARAVRTTQTYDARDTIIYALGVGMGMDPLDMRQLAFVTGAEPARLPTWASTLAWTRFADLELQLTYAGIVHLEQRMVLHKQVARPKA